MAPEAALYCRQQLSSVSSAPFSYAIERCLPTQPPGNTQGPGQERLKFLMNQWLLRSLCESTEMEFGGPGVFSQCLSIVINTPELPRGQQVVILTTWIVRHRFNDGLDTVQIASKAGVRNICDFMHNAGQVPSASSAWRTRAVSPTTVAWLFFVLSAEDVLHVCTLAD